MTISTFEAAKKICHLSNWGITNLKLQKVLYLTHMMYMGKNGSQPLISDYFRAWDYGPVVPELYHEVKMYGNKPIRSGFYRTPVVEGIPEAEEIEKACSFLLNQTASRLVDFTHRTGGAWQKSYAPGQKNIIIPNNDIIQEYRDLFNTG